MKKALSAVLASLALAVMAASCTTVAPGYGLAGQAVVPGATISKTGEASGGYLFGFLPVMSADNSVSAAARNGGITKIATVDSKKVSYLGIWVVRTTIVTGE